MNDVMQSVSLTPRQVCQIRETRFIRQGKVIIELDPETGKQKDKVVFASISKAKKQSWTIQKNEDGFLGLGTVAVKPSKEKESKPVTLDASYKKKKRKLTTLQKIREQDRERLKSDSQYFTRKFKKQLGINKKSTVQSESD